MSKSFYIHKKNGTSIHIAAPSQHKHKIKHDKTTMQSSCHAGEAYLAWLIYIRIHTRSFIRRFAQ